MLHGHQSLRFFRKCRLASIATCTYIAFQELHPIRPIISFDGTSLTYRSWANRPAPHQEAAGQLPSGESAGATDPDLTDQPSYGDGEDSLDHAEGCQARPETGEALSNTDPWRLNPERMPRSITLELPEALLAELLGLAKRQNRCLNEIATDLIAAQLHTDPKG
jgi:hypothetical protein